MSRLFNKKEDVIDFQLTPLGRTKLRNGTFNPKYYAFGDSDVVYDTLYYGITGSQNQTFEDLDVKERPTVFTYPDTTKDKTVYRSEFYMPSIVGSSEISNNLYPAFELKLYNGNISGSISYSTSTFLNQKIPTVNVKLKCKYDKKDNNFIEHEYLLLELNEINGVFEKENFEISISRRETRRLLPLNAQIVVEQKLFFTENEVPEHTNTEPILLEDSDIDLQDVNYWFDIQFDENISEDIEFENSPEESIYLRPENNDTSRNC